MNRPSLFEALIALDDPADDPLVEVKSERVESTVSPEAMLMVRVVEQAFADLLGRTWYCRSNDPRARTFERMGVLRAAAYLHRLSEAPMSFRWLYREVPEIAAAVPHPDKVREMVRPLLARRLEMMEVE